MRARFSFLTLSGGFGGMEIHTIQLARTLLSRGHTVEIVEIGHDVYRPVVEKSDVGLAVRSVPIETDDAKPLQRAVQKALANRRDVVAVVPKGWFPQGGLAFEVAIRRASRRLVTIEHLAIQASPAIATSRHSRRLLRGFGLWRRRDRMVGWLRGRVPHRIVCVSDSVRQQLIDVYRFPSGRTVTVRNGIDTERFVPSRRHRDTARHKWRVDESTMVFGFVGRLNPMKNLPSALEAFADVRKSASNRHELRLALIGAGECETELRALAATLGIADAVVFSPFTERPEEVYPALDVFVLPSLNEGLPLALLEAMSCGCAAIATAVGGVAEVIATSEVGWLVPPANVPALAGAMRNALHEGDALRDVGARARDRVMRHFNASRQFELLAELLETEAAQG